MSIKIYNSKYKNVPAVTMESNELTIQFLPEFGGKMASLVHNKTSKEFLIQGNNPEYKVLKYDGDYVESECSGFDDMFPTIDRFYYTEYPWKGTEVPDHGEVCSLSWDKDILEDCLYMRVYGVRFPYKLEKWIRFKTDNVFTIEYKATNLSSFDMDFIWAAHMMINVEEGGEIIVPYGENTAATCVFSEDRNFATVGDKILWPIAKRRDGGIQDLRITARKDEKGNNYKIYFDEKVPEGWCAYRYNSHKLQLKLLFPPERVPYLSIWLNEGSFHNFQNIALEPCTGSYDRPDMAKIHGQNSIIKAKSEYSWFLDFHIEQYG